MSLLLGKQSIENSQQYIIKGCKKKKRNKSAMKTQYITKVKKGWSNSEISTLTKYSNQLYDEQQRITAERLLNKQANEVSFYKITPKKDLPKNLQKMSFQTLNTKQMNGTSIVKVYHKQPMTQKENQMRKILKQNGQILMLSEIYNYLDEPLESKKMKEKKLMKENLLLSNVINQLDEWQKNVNKKKCNEIEVQNIKLPSLGNKQQMKSYISKKKQQTIKKFQIGSDYQNQIEKNLQMISNSNSNYPNIITRYTSIENSSKLLKKELQEMKELIKKEIEDTTKKLTETRKEHHKLYEQKLKLQLEKPLLNEQRKSQGQEKSTQNINCHMMKQLSSKTLQDNKKDEIQNNEVQINKIKKKIQWLENQKLRNEEQLKNITKAEKAYYKISLKHGLDCRSTGLVWLTKKLELHDSDIMDTQFPQYLDKKSAMYLIAKSKNQDVLETLLKQKKQFVHSIGGQRRCSSHERKSSIIRFQTKKSIILQKSYSNIEQIDGIKEVSLQNSETTNIPKRCNRSMKKISALRQQYLRNENLLKYSQRRSGLKLGVDLTGLTGIQIYKNIAQKIKKIDFTKLKKQKSQQQNDKLHEYQSIIRTIETLHIQMEEQDLQHQNYLLSQYQGNKEQFFTIAAACFGIKRAYSLIIQHFSWKNQK